MCPLCLATTGLYLAGGISGGAATSFLTISWLRRQAGDATQRIPVESQEKRDDDAQDRDT